MKICGKCKETKSLEEFSKDNNRKDGRCFACKNCIREYHQRNRDDILKRKKEYYQENKDHFAELGKTYRQNNKEKILQRKAEYYQNNKEKIAEHMAEYYQNNKESFKKRYRENEEERKETRMEYRERNPIAIQASELSNSVRRRAKKNKIPIDLDFISFPSIMNWLKRQPRCECCNVEFDMGYKNGKHGPQKDSPSIDKFHPDKGYVKGNTFLICWRCNKLKSDGSIGEFEILINWLKKKVNEMKTEKEEKGRMTWTYTELHPAVLHRMRMEERQAEG